MNSLANRPLTRFHYVWIIVPVIFLILLASAGIRAAPSVMMLPLEHEFGWSRATISLSISVNLALYGLTGPFSAAAMQRFGVRRMVVIALAVLASASAASVFMRASWQMVMLWGLIIGVGTGAAALSLSATIVNRWFTTHRGLAMGILTASSGTGQLVFLPVLAAVAERFGWRSVALCVAGTALLALVLALVLLRERPADVGMRRFGAPLDEPDEIKTVENPVRTALNTLALAVRKRDFWLLFGSFFVCGASTNGYIGSHFIAMCADHGFSEVHGASILAAMGVLDLVGTTASGWLSDRFNSRVLLFWYYGLRGISLIYLPYAFGLDFFGLPVFALFYGLDWIATVPPTVRLANDVFGRAAAPIVFGWVVAGHQLGAAFAAYGAGLLRSSLGDYTVASMISGGLCIVSAIMVLRIYPAGRRGAVAGSAA